MGQHTARHSLGTVLLGLGLILVLVVGGYFVWSEIQSAQVRAQLHNSASAAGMEAPTGAAQVAPQATQTRPAVAAGAAATTAPRATQTATRRAAQATATPRLATATPAPSAAAVSVASVAAPVGATPIPATVVPAAAAPATAGTASTTAPPPAAVRGRVEPVRIAIPDLKINAPVVPMGWEVVQTAAGPVSQWVIPKNEAGHHINSAGIGEAGNLVISGHNNIFGRVFEPISLAWDNDARIKVDDFTDRSDILDGRRIDLFDAQGNQHSYTITGFYRLKDTGVSQAQRIANGKYILPTEDERVTLVTCWPPTNNTHRLIVIAEPVD